MHKINNMTVMALIAMGVHDCMCILGVQACIQYVRILGVQACIQYVRILGVHDCIQYV